MDFDTQWQKSPTSSLSGNSYRHSWEQFLRHVAQDDPLRSPMLEGAGTCSSPSCYQSDRERRWIDVPALIYAIGAVFSTRVQRIVASRTASVQARSNSSRLIHSSTVYLVLAGAEGDGRHAVANHPVRIQPAVRGADVRLRADFRDRRGRPFDDRQTVAQAKRMIVRLHLEPGPPGFPSLFFTRFAAFSNAAL